MNLYFRLFFTVMRALWAPRVRPGDTVELRLRVWPTDLDLNGHMNNGRYLTLVDLGLVTAFIRSGFARLALSKGWRPMGGGSVAYFRRGLTVFQVYTLRFTIVAWDEFWSYARFEFVRDGQLCATGFMKGAAHAPRGGPDGRGGLVRNADIYPALGFDQPSPPMPEDLQAWVAVDRLLGERTRG